MGEWKCYRKRPYEVLGAVTKVIFSWDMSWNRNVSGLFGAPPPSHREYDAFGNFILIVMCYHFIHELPPINAKSSGTDRISIALFFVHACERCVSVYVYTFATDARHFRNGELVFHFSILNWINWKIYYVYIEVVADAIQTRSIEVYYTVFFSALAATKTRDEMRWAKVRNCVNMRKGSTGASRNNFAINANDVFLFYFALCSPRQRAQHRLLFRRNREEVRDVGRERKRKKKQKRLEIYANFIYISFIFNLFWFSFSSSFNGYIIALSYEMVVLSVIHFHLHKNKDRPTHTHTHAYKHTLTHSLLIERNLAVRRTLSLSTMLKFFE